MRNRVQQFVDLLTDAEAARVGGGQFPEIRKQAVAGTARQQDPAAARHEGSFGDEMNGLRFGAAIGQLVDETARAGGADFDERTGVALGTGGGADQRAEFHQRLVELADVRVRQEVTGEFPERLQCSRGFYIGADGEHAGKHAGDISIDERGALAERDAGDGAGGVATDAGQGAQLGGCAGQFAAVLADEELRGAMQVAGARIVAETFPQFQDAIVRCAGKRLDGGESAEPTGVVGADGVDACLLEHDFADPDAVRVAGGAPGKLAVMTTVPARQVAVEGGAEGFGIDPRGGCMESCRHG